MALLTAQNVAANGTVADLDAACAAAAGGGDTVAHSGKESIFVFNGGGSQITVTVASQPDNFGQTLTAHDITRTVAAGKWAIIGPLEASKYRNASTGLLSITYSGVTSVKVGVFSFAVTS